MNAPTPYEILQTAEFVEGDAPGMTRLMIREIIIGGFPEKESHDIVLEVLENVRDDLDEVNDWLKTNKAGEMLISVHDYTPENFRPAALYIDFETEAHACAFKIVWC